MYGGVDVKIFVDTANIEQIRAAVQLGFVAGVTTNPSLIAREGGCHEEIIAEICRLVKGPVSAEVLATDTAGMIKEARQLSSIAENVVIKIPVTKEGLQAVARLAGEGIRTNVTLVFSANQALLAARAGAAYVSPFIGRLDDIGHDGVQVVRQIKEIFSRHRINCEVIAASIRHPAHVIEAALVGADIATIPFAVLDKMLHHPLTDIGLERFLQDANKG